MLMQRSAASDLGFSGSLVLGGPVGVLIALCVPFNMSSQFRVNMFKHSEVIQTRVTAVTGF